MAKMKPPEIATLSSAQLEQLLLELKTLLPPQTYQLVESLLRTLQWLLGVIEQKTASLRRLRRILFADKTEKAINLFGKDQNPTSAAPQTPSQSEGKAKRKGHGRKGAKDYSGAKRVWVKHLLHCVGGLCPKCLKGKLYQLKVPARVVRIVAQPMFSAIIHELERLRCALCGAVFTAQAPAEAGLTKHDPSVGIMLAIMRYGAGFPMYRMAKWQTFFGVPLPASTQWKLIAESSETPALVFEALILTAAQGQLLHNDDTVMRVQELLNEVAQDGPEAERTGIFTSCILAQVDQVQIALFFTGHEHAGENLARVLQLRNKELGKPLQMSDGLSRNDPKVVETDKSNCLIHGRRHFVDQIENFPEECRQVIQSIGQIYHHDDQAKELHLTDIQRLAYHQEHSGPVMAQLKTWMQEQIDQKRVEPNSGLGQAIAYMLKHWKPLTRFLEVAGAPLDNNICERALKTAIMHRKNSMSYKTKTGARIGDIFMSLLHTCQLNGINPFVYLMALLENAAQVAKDPMDWLPWTYRQTLERSQRSEPANTS